MKRRQLLKYAAGISTIPVVASPIVATAAADVFVEYTPEIYTQKLESGEPFMLGFLSDW